LLPRNRNAHKGPKPSKEGKNWLQQIDSEAASQPRYSDWIEVDSLFKVVRHKRLQPKRSAALSKSNFDSDRKELFDHIDELESEIADKIPQVLDGLNSRQ
jgi:hypothetical protein